MDGFFQDNDTQMFASVSSIDRKYAIRIHDLETLASNLAKENHRLNQSIVSLSKRIELLEKEQAIPLIKKIFMRKK